MKMKSSEPTQTTSWRTVSQTPGRIPTFTCLKGGASWTEPSAGFATVVTTCNRFGRDASAATTTSAACVVLLDFSAKKHSTWTLKSTCLGKAWSPYRTSKSQGGLKMLRHSFGDALLATSACYLLLNRKTSSTKAHVAKEDVQK